MLKSDDVKTEYNESLKADTHPYEWRRWFSNPQAKAGYDMTKEAIECYALPLYTPSQHIFELGPGAGTWTKLLLEQVPDVQVDLVDISEEMLKQAQEALGDKPQLNYIVSDIMEFTAGKQYDGFFSSRMIEYVPDKKMALERVVAALKPGAPGFIITKTPHYDRIKAQGKQVRDFHSGQISPSDLSALLSGVGCQVIAVKPVTTVFPKLSSGAADTALHSITKFLPLSLSQPFSESYCLTFKKQ